MANNNQSAFFIHRSGQDCGEHYETQHDCKTANNQFCHISQGFLVFLKHGFSSLLLVLDVGLMVSEETF